MNEITCTTVDRDQCTACGQCVSVCPDQVLSVSPDDDWVVVDPGECMQCGQCVSVCPTESISVSGITNTPPEFDQPGPSTPVLMDLITMRRSCRKYKASPIPPSTLKALVDTAIWAPSSTNSQVWNFTIVKDRPEMEKFAVSVGNFYRRLNRLAARPLARGFSKLFMKGVLGDYYENYHDTVETALAAWDENRKDLLFHGATGAIVIGTKPGGSGPTEDALLATQNILLAAQSLGLGTCLIGFAVEAMKRDKTVSQKLGIPDTETVRSVIALGHPDIKYLRPAGRKIPEIRYTT